MFISYSIHDFDAYNKDNDLIKPESKFKKIN